jgi:hypothetical protein
VNDTWPSFETVISVKPYNPDEKVLQALDSNINSDVVQRRIQHLDPEGWAAHIRGLRRDLEILKVSC